ncbi:MAG: hypothetical protein HY287_12220 [Planctomycetes bacterium]|nr:hypothetical protein [Planctomycetota bacterium]MBI3835086.1 hypothetical protein [Planctomycetota bacterium]
MPDDKLCPICRLHQINPKQSLKGTLVDCPSCGVFAFDYPSDHQFEHLAKHEPEKLKQAAAMLFVRRIEGLTEPIFIRFDRKVVAPHEHYVILCFDDLVAEYPDTVSAQIERCLRNFCVLSERPGQTIQFHHQEELAFAFLSLETEAWTYYANNLVSMEYLKYGGSPNSYFVTPKGWERYESLTSGQGARSNPVFVAMWFGEPDRTKEMKELYDLAIEPACKSAHWAVKKANTVPHNDQIMGQVLQDIRVAPFVIADLTENNPGVYYEAGFAHSLKKSVIFCCPKDQKKVHFDVSGINQIRYSVREDLRSQLENNILFTQGEGPHKSK